MKNFFYESIEGNLDKLSSERNLRILPTISHDGKWIIRDGGKMLNLSSNDYLGIASDKEKSAMFCKEKSYGSFVFGSGSSRLLTGNYRIYDEAEDFGSYAPKNFTRIFKGTVPADYALYNSLNLPALTVLNLLGPEKFLSVINKNQRNIFLPKGAKAGLPIILGGCGISLYNLTALYTTLFNDGKFFYPKNLINEKTALAYELIEKKAARATFNILKNTAAPQSFIKNHQISYKTGTSYDFIDALSIGSSGRYTAGIWIGKPDGSSNYPKTGYNAAAPILYALLDSLSQQQLKKEDLPLTGALSPLPLPNLEDLTQNMSSQRLKTNKNYAKHPIKITFPQNNSKIKTTDEGYVNVIIEGGQAPYTLYINGIEQNDSSWFKVNKSGFYDLCVIDNEGNESLITIQIFT